MKIKKIIKYGIIFMLVLLCIVFIINFYVVKTTKNQIITSDKISDLKDIDCILVLGAGIWGDKPSPMLEDRLNEAISLYKQNVSAKIIMSGDHGREEYDEVNIMKDYAIEKGVPSEAIFMDHAGFSSYESIYRLREIFEAKKVVIVTQKYHLFRALYIANQFDLEAYGVNSDPRRYVGAAYRELREVLARNKDFIQCIIKPKPTYLGETIPVSGNGDITNDKENAVQENEIKNYKKKQNYLKKVYGKDYHYYHLEDVTNKHGKVIEHRIVKNEDNLITLKTINFIFTRFNGVFSGTDITKYPYKIIHDELGIKKCRFYDLRGSYATKTLHSGAEIRDIADNLGHKNIETTENYYISSSEESRKEANNLFDKHINSNVIEQIAAYKY